MWTGLEWFTAGVGTIWYCSRSNSQALLRHFSAFSFNAVDPLLRLTIVQPQLLPGTTVEVAINGLDCNVIAGVVAKTGVAKNVVAAKVRNLETVIMVAFLSIISKFLLALANSARDPRHALQKTPP